MADLHPSLLEDCLELGRFSLCRLLLMKDANYPWFILVPDREDISEIHHLSEEDQLQLIRESALLSAVIEEAFRADKITASGLMVHLVAGHLMKCLESVYNDSSVECAAGMCISQT